MLLTALFRRLLFLYPTGFREEFGDEMAWVFRQAYAGTRGENALVRIGFCAKELQGLLVGSVRERVRVFFALPCPDRWKGGNMEAKFRFPRATLVLMLLSLLGVVLTLEQARMIEVHYGNNVGVPPEWPMLPWIFGRLLLIALGFAAIAWGIFFALRRSGIHRLEELKPWRGQK
jgi:hypothetical protein